MTVYDLCWLAIESSEVIEIWSTESDDTVFKGTYAEAMSSEFESEEVGSFGIENGILVINI